MRDVFLRTVAILGLIAVLLLGAWGIIQLAVALPNLFGSIGSGASSLWGSASAKEALVVSAPASLSSGQTLQLTWNHQNKSGEYSYAVSYACESGLSLKAPLPTGSYQAVACNTPFNYTSAAQSLTVVPAVSGSAAVPLILTVSATKLSSGAVTASGSATTNIAPQAAAASTGTKTTAAPKASTAAKSTIAYYPAKARAAMYGYPDLAVAVNALTPNGSRELVTFTIQNIGTNVANAGWTFNAILPIQGGLSAQAGYTFASQPQQALYPGDKIVYTLAFDRMYTAAYNQYPYYNGYGWGYNGGNSYTCNSYGPCFNYNGGYNSYPYNYNNYNLPAQAGYQNGTVTITADPLGALYELNKANNTITVPVY